MVRHAAFALALAAAMTGAANAGASTSRDGAVIVDSGSTNTSGYRIEVWSVVQGGARAFAVTPAVSTRFFADLKAARTANITGSPCMKSASFGTTTHATWHGWTSPDLDCPATNPLLSALIRDVNAIRAASGIGSLPGLRRGAGAGGPVHVEAPSPSPDQSPPEEKR
jgi:hypothetical protein